MSYLVVLTTVSTRKEAQTLAASLLESRLAACVNISAPVESHYEWKGKVCCDREYLLFIKTRRSLYARLEKALLKMHSYDEPEIIAFPVEKGSRGYLNWVMAQTRAVSRR